MWKANVINKVVNKDVLTLTIEYFLDDKSIITDTLNFSNQPNLDSVVKNRIKQLKEIRDYEANLVLGEVDLTEKVLDADEVNKRAYYEVYAKWENIQRDIKLGLISQYDERVIQIEADLKSLYRAEYSGI